MEIGRYCSEHGIISAIIIGIIGSVESARLNFLIELPGKYDTVDYSGPLEIVCAQGSVALKEEIPIIHIHTQLSGGDFSRGGHLAKAIVFSTAEVTLGELDYQLLRRFDSYTGLNELHG
jgi:predicted DNA-binding protein with PD1-like motif